MEYEASQVSLDVLPAFRQGKSEYGHFLSEKFRIYRVLGLWFVSQLITKINIHLIYLISRT